MKYFKGVLTTAVLASFFTGSVYGSIVSSTFDSNADGWLISGDSTSSAPTYDSAGFIKASDSVAGGVWYFDAPSKYLGDMSGAYGQSLLFDLKQTGTGWQFDDADVIIEGGGLKLSVDAGDNPWPLDQWVSYSVIFDEFGGWMNGSAAASQADLLAVLGSLDSLKIRGEFIGGDDVGALDNVRMNAVPVPAAFWLFGSGIIALFSLRGRTRK